MTGTIRAIDEEAGDIVRGALKRICDSLEHYYGIKIDLIIDNKFLATVNEADAVKTARGVIRSCFGEDALQQNYKPSMASEDFSYMLVERPGAYVHLGAGDKDHTHGLHSQKYDFNDSIIPHGIVFLANVALASLDKQNAG